jgi:hypothetical protein
MQINHSVQLPATIRMLESSDWELLFITSSIMWREATYI